MRFFLPALALATVISAPVAATSMSCAQFANLTADEQLTTAVAFEPKSVESAPIAHYKADVADAETMAKQPSSGPAGTVDPDMLEAEKVAAILEACDADLQTAVSNVLTIAFAKRPPAMERTSDFPE